MAKQPNGKSQQQASDPGDGEPGPLGAIKRAIHGVMAAVGDPRASDEVDALKLLEAQHRAIDALMARVENDTGAQKVRAFQELADLLAVHATIEEKVFYPAVKLPSIVDMLRESVEEHLAVKRLIADLLTMDASAAEFDAKVAVLKEQVHHHAIEEEEGKMFPRLRKELDADYLAAVANDMIALMVDLQAQGNPREQVPAETDQAAPV